MTIRESASAGRGWSNTACGFSLRSAARCICRAPTRSSSAAARRCERVLPSARSARRRDRLRHRVAAISTSTAAGFVRRRYAAGGSERNPREGARRGGRRLRVEPRVAARKRGARGGQLPDPRHAVQQGARARMLLDRGRQGSATRRSATAVAIDARAPKFDGGIVTRVDCVSLGIVVNKHAQRFYDEGEDFWPKRYAIWGRLVAGQPDQIGYSIIDSKSMGQFMPPVFPPIKARLDRRARRALGLDAAALEDDRRRVQRGGASRHVRSHHARRLRDRRHRAAEDALGAADRHAALLRLPVAARHHVHLSRRRRERARAC